MWMDPKLKVGLNGVNRDQVYLFLTEDRETNDFLAPETFKEALRALLERFPSPIIRKIAAELSSENNIICRPLEQMLLPRPWSKGRVVLIGDAVHATTPHLAAGACNGIEDAMVLAQELARHDSVNPHRLFATAAMAPGLFAIILLAAVPQLLDPTRRPSAVSGLQRNHGGRGSCSGAVLPEPHEHYPTREEAVQSRPMADNPRYQYHDLQSGHGVFIRGSHRQVSWF